MLYLLLKNNSLLSFLTRDRLKFNIIILDKIKLVHFKPDHIKFNHIKID